MLVCESAKRRPSRVGRSPERTLRHLLPRDKSPSVARAFVLCPTYPFGSLLLMANYLSERAIGQGNRTWGSDKEPFFLDSVLSYDPFLKARPRCVMSKGLQLIQERARELARSGKFFGARAVAFELQFEPGYSQGAGWISSPEAQNELDRLCSDARASNRRSDPEAA